MAVTLLKPSYATDPMVEVIFKGIERYEQWKITKKIIDLLRLTILV